MIYIALDLETTGLRKKDPNHILMLSMILDDLSNPKPVDQLTHFTVYVDPRDKDGTLNGEPFALQMNADILRQLDSNNPKYPVIRADDIHRCVLMFIAGAYPSYVPHKTKVTLAGKNVGAFDYQFLPPETQALFRHRILDVGSMYAELGDPSLPDLTCCKRRANIPTPVSHDAYEDALDVIRCVRHKLLKQK